MSDHPNWGPEVDRLLADLASLRARAESAEAEVAKWRETALSIQRNIEDRHTDEKRREYVRGHIDGFWDLGRVIDGSLDRADAAEAAASGLADALRKLITEHAWGPGCAHPSDLNAARAALRSWDEARAKGERGSTP